MRLAAVRLCILPGLLLAATVSAQPAGSAPSSYGDRQAGHFGDPGAGYFGNAGDGNFGSQSLDAARARAAGTAKPGAARRSNAPSPYVVLDQPQKPRKAAKPDPATPPPAPVN